MRSLNIEEITRRVEGGRGLQPVLLDSANLRSTTSDIMSLLKPLDRLRPNAFSGVLDWRFEGLGSSNCHSARRKQPRSQEINDRITLLEI
jgi:hypothetical protein